MSHSIHSSTKMGTSQILRPGTGTIDLQTLCVLCSIEAAGGCQLDLMLVYEVFDSSDASLLYPVNTLRNLARMQVNVD